MPADPAAAGPEDRCAEASRRIADQAFAHALSHPLIVVVGPTASGKTDLAQIVAQRLGGDVLSCDSMQIYRGMDIGTGKISADQMLVPHHGIDLVEPGQPYSAALFQEYGRAVVERLDTQARSCVLCGGTGFYVRAVVDDFDFPEGEQQGNPVRDEYNAKVREMGAQAVWDMLNARDSESAALIAPADSKRVVRAFEMLAAGTSYARQHEKFQAIGQVYPAVFLGLQVTPGALNARIDARVDRMMASGLVDEVKTLLNRGLRDAITAQQAIGYKEIVAALDGRITMHQAVEQIKTTTHRYAKRQRTWFRKDKRIHWLDADSSDTGRLADESLAWLARMEETSENRREF